MADRHDTIAAIATPSGNGGIGIVRLSGRHSLQIAREISRIEARPRHAHFCTFRDHQDRTIDQGILIYFNGPLSFTGEDVVELQGHGGRTVLNLLLQEAISRGARLARAGEFTERAYLNDRIDLVQAEAIADLIDSVSDQAVRSAARSLQGEFSEHIHRAIDNLISLRVYVESALDFPEEEIDLLARDDVEARLQGLISVLDELLKRSIAGSRLRSGLRAAIIGAPNVGKSSLLNRLARTNRAIVDESAGTTRDTIEDSILIDGAPVDIVDTAGIRQSSDPVEQQGIQRSRVEIQKADVVILMTDTPAEQAVASELLAELGESCTYVVVHNKTDIYHMQPSTQVIQDVQHVYLSAKTGEGVDMLRDILGQLSGAANTGEDLIMARQRHINALRSAREFIVTAMAGYKSTGSAELLAEEMRRAQLTLGEITGEFHNDDLLGEIFTRFCIGK